MDGKPKRPPKLPDPTPEEIWGTPGKMGLAAQERLARQQKRQGFRDNQLPDGDDDGFETIG